jgi:hypothetical protein
MINRTRQPAARSRSFPEARTVGDSFKMAFMPPMGSGPGVVLPPSALGSGDFGLHGLRQSPARGFPRKLRKI